jgi:hypothetical protein
MTSLPGRSPAACEARDMGVSMPEGGMVFTVIPYAAYSRASALVIAMTAPLEAV